MRHYTFNGTPSQALYLFPGHMHGRGKQTGQTCPHESWSAAVNKLSWFLFHSHPFSTHFAFDTQSFPISLRFALLSVSINEPLIRPVTNVLELNINK